MNYEITANEDDSVVLKAGSFTAHIKGDSFKDAAWAARYLGEFITMTYDLSGLALKLRLLNSSVSSLNEKIAYLSKDVEDIFDSIIKEK